MPARPAGMPGPAGALHRAMKSTLIFIFLAARIRGLGRRPAGAVGRMPVRVLPAR